MGYVWLLEGQRGTMTPQLRQVILPGGQTQYQPAPWKAMSSRITGMVELPTGAIRFLLTDDQGQLLLSTGFGDPVVLQMNPKLPAGGTVALRSYGAFNSYALGGQAHPYIHSVTGYSSPGTWTRVAGPISGDPVDFVLLPPLQPQLETISYGCRRGRAVPFELSASGAPKLGSPSFVYSGTAAPPRSSSACSRWGSWARRRSPCAARRLHAAQHARPDPARERGRARALCAAVPDPERPEPQQPAPADAVARPEPHAGSRDRSEQRGLDAHRALSPRDFFNGLLVPRRRSSPDMSPRMHRRSLRRAPSTDRRI
jgi:hypothetical protein